MPKIEHIVGEGPELAESQRRVLWVPPERIILEDHTGADLDRAGLQQLLGWADRGEIAGTIMLNMDRLYRPEPGQEWRVFPIIERLEAAGPVVFVQDAIPADNPMSGLFRYLDSWRAGQERQSIRERTMRGRKAKVAAGGVGTGWGRWGGPYGQIGSKCGGNDYRLAERCADRGIGFQRLERDVLGVVNSVLKSDGALHAARRKAVEEAEAEATRLAPQRESLRREIDGFDKSRRALAYQHEVGALTDDELRSKLDGLKRRKAEAESALRDLGGIGAATVEVDSETAAMLDSLPAYPSWMGGFVSVPSRAIDALASVREVVGRCHAGGKVSDEDRDEMMVISDWLGLRVSVLNDGGLGVQMRLPAELQAASETVVSDTKETSSPLTTTSFSAGHRAAARRCLRGPFRRSCRL